MATKTVDELIYNEKEHEVLGWLTYLTSLPPPSGSVGALVQNLDRGAETAPGFSRPPHAAQRNIMNSGKIGDTAACENKLRLLKRRLLGFGASSREDPPNRGTQDENYPRRRPGLAADFHQTEPGGNSATENVAPQVTWTRPGP